MTKQTIDEPLLCAKELADKLGRNERYIYACKVDGFEMPGGRATLSSLLEHLKKHPRPRRRMFSRSI